MFSANKTTFSFGSPSATTTTASGGFGGFGTTAPAATTAGSTGFSFGASTAAKPQQTLFGTTQTGQSTFGGFGQPSTQTQSTSFGGFGAPSSTAATTTGFGNTTTSGGGLFNFGAGATTTATTQPTNTSFSFGAPTAGTSSGGFGGFGTTTSTAPAASTSFGGFGLSQPQQQQQQQQASIFGGINQTANQQLIQSGQTMTAPQANQNVDNLMNALVYAQIFNDERDLILAKWNQIQAYYGTGKVFYQNTVIDVKEDNRLTRFKTIGYSCKPSTKNEDGLVCLLINSPQESVKTNQANITDSLNKIFGSVPSLSINIESIKPMVNDKTEFIFYIVERSPTGQTRRISSLDVFNHMNKQEPAMRSLTTSTSIKQQLEQINVISVYPLVGLDDEQIRQYLNTPPVGINPILWEQAKRNNPNSKKLLPVPIIGFKGNFEQKNF